MQNVLYHGSPYTITDAIKPGKTPDLTGQKGNFTFATGIKPLAAAYALRTHDNFAACGMTSVLPFVVFTDRNDFINNPPTGKLYQVPKDHFTKTPLLNDVTDEWQSPHVVPILRQKTESVTPDSAMQLGVQLFTLSPGVTREQWHAYCAASTAQVDMTNPESITRAVHKAFASGIADGLIIHENAVRNINPFPFPPNQAAALKAHAGIGAIREDAPIHTPTPQQEKPGFLQRIKNFLSGMFGGKEEAPQFTPSASNPRVSSPRPLPQTDEFQFTFARDASVEDFLRQKGPHEPSHAQRTWAEKVSTPSAASHSALNR